MSPMTIRRTRLPLQSERWSRRVSTATTPLSILCCQLQDRQWVHGVAIHANLEVEVRARRVAGTADAGDDLAGLDPLALYDQEFRSVSVVVLGKAVLDYHQITVAPLPAGEVDLAADRCADRVAGLAVDVEARVEVRATYP